MGKYERNKGEGNPRKLGGLGKNGYTNANMIIVLKYLNARTIYCQYTLSLLVISKTAYLFDRFIHLFSLNTMIHKAHTSQRIRNDSARNFANSCQLTHESVNKRKINKQINEFFFTIFYHLQLDTSTTNNESFRSRVTLSIKNEKSLNCYSDNCIYNFRITNVLLQKRMKC